FDMPPSCDGVYQGTPPRTLVTPQIPWNPRPHANIRPSMRTHPVVAAVLLCGLPAVHSIAQEVDPKLLREVSAVRAELARSAAALRRYTWIEETEVLVSGKVKSSTALSCRYD